MRVSPAAPRTHDPCPAHLPEPGQGGNRARGSGAQNRCHQPKIKKKKEEEADYTAPKAAPSRRQRLGAGGERPRPSRGGRRRGGGRGRGTGGGGGPENLCLPLKSRAQSQNPGVKVNFLPHSPFPRGRERKEGHPGGGEGAWFRAPGLSLRSSGQPCRLLGLPGEPRAAPLLPPQERVKGEQGGKPGRLGPEENSGPEIEQEGEGKSTAPSPPAPKSGDSLGLAGSPEPPEAPRPGGAGRAPEFTGVFRLGLFMKAFLSKFELSREGKL